VKGLIGALDRVGPTALLSSLAGGVAWWLIGAIEAVHGRVPGLFGPEGVLHTILIGMLATALPNWVALAVIDRYLVARPRVRARLQRRLWPVVGAVYGLVVLVPGVAAGLAAVLGPVFMVLLALSGQALPLHRLVLAVLTMPALYPAAAVAGMVAMGRVAMLAPSPARGADLDRESPVSS
jgi:hypothetical protein